jgi:hypothetical protein
MPFGGAWKHKSATGKLAGKLATKISQEKLTTKIWECPNVVGNNALLLPHKNCINSLTDIFELGTDTDRAKTEKKCGTCLNLMNFAESLFSGKCPTFSHENLTSQWKKGE